MCDYEYSIRNRKKYGYIDLSELKKKLKKQDVNLSQSLINKANELSHDSGKKYTVEDIKKFHLEVTEMINSIKNIILTSQI